MRAPSTPTPKIDEVVALVKQALKKGEMPPGWGLAPHSHEQQQHGFIFLRKSGMIKACLIDLPHMERAMCTDPPQGRFVIETYTTADGWKVENYADTPEQLVAAFITYVVTGAI